MDFLNPGPESASPVVYLEDEAYSGLTDIEEEIWLLIRVIRDPEHPYTLSQLRVVSPNLVRLIPGSETIVIEFKPTVRTCSLASLIGLCIRERILRNLVLDPCYKLVIATVDGSHESYREINRQLSDKERVSAALENDNVAILVRNCIEDRY